MSLVVNCLPRVVKVSSATGCTLTATSIKGLTPGELEALANKEIDLARVILNAAEAKMLGVQEHGLATLLRSSIKNIKPALSQTKIDEQSIVLPYIQRTQRSFINANYFTIEAGVADSEAGTTVNGVVIPASAWKLTLNLGASWLKTDLENIERYFKPGNTLIVLTWSDTTAKNAVTLVFKIIRASNADAGGVKKAYVTVEPNVASDTWAGMSSPEKAAFQPTFGVAQTGANSVSDREAWCVNSPADMSRKIIVNWMQTSRFSRQLDESYQKTLDSIMKGKVNAFMQGFQFNTIAEQNKRAAQLEDEEWLRSVFFGQRINDKQTVEGYQNLPVVYDIEDGSCPLEYKANALGIFTFLTDCNRVIDLNGGDLDLDYVFSQLYLLKRHRESDGDRVSVIDSMTDRLTSNKILDAMTKYYKVKYGFTLERVAKIGEKITHEGYVLFNYNVYDVPEQSVQWAVFHDTFFDDMIDAFPATVGGQDFKSRARQLWFLDWSDISVGIAGTKSVKRKQPSVETNSLYKCVITPNIKEFNLRSTKWTVMVDRPHRHLIIHNFSGNCPTISAVGCSVPNP